jgi:Tfp pilus assembly protein PilZ
MGDLVTQAKTARETLARALGALQSDPTVPPGLLAVAEPVAQAMGALHAIERSAPNVDLATAPTARDHIRSALGMLQTQGGSHAAVATATEAVATSLGVVFGLVRAGEAAAAAPAPAAQPQAPAPAQPQASGGGTTAPLQPAPAAQLYQQPAPAPQQQQAAAPAYQQPAPAPQQQAAAPAYQQPAPQQPTAQAYQQPAQAQAYQAPAAAPVQQPQQAQQAYQPQPQQPAPHASEPAYHPPAQPAPPAAAAASAPATNATRFDAPLGTNSNSNFYKGLSGNDVVEHGGLFIATYAKVPPMGAPVSLHVVLPGGYEFEAMAVIAWTRETGSSDAPPGFGARFTQISPEARQLIYRYVRNREPLFHDDF